MNIIFFRVINEIFTQQELILRPNQNELVQIKKVCRGNLFLKRKHLKKTQQNLALTHKKLNKITLNQATSVFDLTDCKSNTKSNGFFIDHILTVLSSLADIKNLQSWDRSTERTASLCPLNTLTILSN